MKLLLLICSFATHSYPRRCRWAELIWAFSPLHPLFRSPFSVFSCSVFHPPVYLFAVPALLRSPFSILRSPFLRYHCFQNG